MLGVSPEGIGTIGMLIDFAVAFGVTAFTADAVGRVQAMVRTIRVRCEAV